MKINKEKYLKLIFHPLITGSSVLIAGSLFANLFNFLFNLFLGRNISVVEYGTVASLLSLISLSAMPVSAVSSTIVRFGAYYFGHNDLGKVKGLFVEANRALFVFASGMLILFFVFANNIGNFFNIHNNTLILLAGVNVFISIIATTNGSLLQAKLAFKFLTSTSILGSFLKLFFGVIFVFLGYSVGGIMWAFFLATLFPYLVSFIPLRFLLKQHIVKSPVQLKTVVGYGIPAMFAIFSLSSFITIDIILVKHFFSQNSAGLYAGLSLIGRVIFFVSAPITTVMFPMIVQRHAKKKKVLNLFLFSLFIIAIPSLILVTAYFIFPKEVILFFLKKEEYLLISEYLGFFGLFIMAFSFLYLIVNFYLSIKKTIVFVPLLIGAGFQTILIWIFHSNFYQIISISFSICLLLFIFLFVYYFLSHEEEEEK